MCYHSSVFTQGEDLDEEKGKEKHREGKYTAEMK